MAGIRDPQCHGSTLAGVGEITFHRWRVMHSHIKTQLVLYVGSVEITLLGGSTGVLGISGSQILRMWSRSLAWIGGQNSDKSS